MVFPAGPRRRLVIVKGPHPRRVVATLAIAIASVFGLMDGPEGPSLHQTVFAQTPPAKESKFPDGPGKAALFKVCRECHGPESAVGELRTREEWSKTLDDMAANGAQGTDEEWNQILDYLDKNFSLILVNKADAKQLANPLDVPQAIADAIVKYREEHGRFATIEDLKKVPGLEAAKVDARKDRFVF